MSHLSAVEIAERRIGKPGEALYSGRAKAVLERSWMAFKSATWMIVLSGFVEPLLNLGVFGYGVGSFIGDITLENGQTVSYASFVVPGLLATAAMMGAIMDSTWNIYWKIHEARLYNAMLSTSLGPLDVALGEIAWALGRGFLYSSAFMIVVTPLGLIESWWALLAIPAGAVIGFGFAAIGMAITSYMSSFQHLNWINAALLPLTLFSGSFFPLSILPGWLEAIMRWSPLTQGIDLMRALTLGTVDASMFIHVAYFAVFVSVGLYFSTRRLNALFMK
jgi:lipooligosaccharide transport system permease protein